MPQGTFDSLCEDVERGIVVTIKHQPTRETDMCPYAQRLLDRRATVGAVLTGELRGNSHDGNPMQCPIMLDPGEECSPSRIVNALGKLAVLEHMAYLQLFVGNQVARRDKRVRLFTSEILTLPLDFQIRFCQHVPGFLAVAALLLLARKSAVQALKPRLRFTVVVGALDGVALGVGVEGFEPDINPHLFPSRNVFNMPVNLDAELDIIAIGPLDNSHPFDLLGGKGFNVLLGIANQTHAAYTTAISEGDMPAIGRELPACLLVLDTSVIVLKRGVAFFARFVVLAVVIEAGNREPRSVGTGLTGLGVETSRKGKITGKDRTIALQSILVSSTSVHPETQALIADELYNANGLIESSELPLRAINFVLVDQHPSCPFALLVLD